MKQALLGANRVFNESVARDDGTTFKTTNQVYSKWIQPAPSNMAISGGRS
jgi:hypothetical protein